MSFCIFYSGAAESNFQKNTQYAFEIEKLSVEQQFLDEESLRNISQDAVAGIYDPRFEFYSFIIPTPFDGESLTQIADALIKMLPIQELNIGEYKKQEYQDLPSFRLSISGKFNQEPIEYLIELVLYDSLVYQHVSFIRSPTEKFPGITQLRPRFKIDKSKAPMKPPGGFSMPTFDQVWLVDDNYFWHAGAKFKVPIDLPGWTYRTGNQARNYHPEALVAFEAQSKAEVLYILGGSNHQSIQDLFETFLNSFPDPGAISMTKTEEFLWYFNLNNQPNPLHYAVKGLKGLESNLLIVMYSRDKTGTFPIPLLTRLRFLDSQAMSLIKKTLDSTKFQFHQIDENQSLSATGYTNFEYGVKWDFNSNEIIEAGFITEESLEADFQVFVHNYTYNYQANLELEKDQFIPHAEYHDNFLASIIGAEETKTTTRSDLRISSFKKKDEKLSYLLITSIKGSKFLRCILWSHNVLDSEKLNLPTWVKTAPESLDLNIYQNNRMSFSIKRRKDWVFRTITHPELKPIGEVIELRERLAEHELYVLNSFYMNEELVLEIFSHEKPFLTDLRPGEASNEIFEDLEVKVQRFHFTLRGKPRLLVQRSFRRGTTLFSLFSFQDPESVAEKYLETIGLELN